MVTSVLAGQERNVQPSLKTLRAEHPSRARAADWQSGSLVTQSTALGKNRWLSMEEQQDETKDGFYLSLTDNIKHNL